MWDKELILQRKLAESSTEQLRTMLVAEIQRAVPDDDLVLSILHILEEREPEVPDTGSEKEKAAWKLFRKRIVITLSSPVTRFIISGGNPSG